MRYNIGVLREVQKGREHMRLYKTVRTDIFGTRYTHVWKIARDAWHYAYMCKKLAGTVTLTSFQETPQTCYRRDGKV